MTVHLCPSVQVMGWATSTGVHGRPSWLQYNCSTRLRGSCSRSVGTRPSDPSSCVAGRPALQPSTGQCQTDGGGGSGMRRNKLLHTAVLGVSMAVPIGVAVVLAAWLLRGSNNDRIASVTLSTVPPSTSGAFSAVSPVASLTPATALTSEPAPSVKITHAPQGEIVLTEWHDTTSTNTCVRVQTYYQNRSDTAIREISQSFVTLYTPRHPEGTYPGLREGPVKTLTQSAGIPPFEQRILYWDVCAPELAKLQNPPRPDGTNSYMSEIGAQPRGFTWTWFSS
ncbi:putative membrane protein [Candidatus Protofrankia californiensis]|uniref:Putative membrane protein n=1 Tax=Candidatus Protofrankia californiensis TaxID=1839754 RepID=A0A1C3NU64_9ACTN|nr:putative membrane protein [Candidatus Protofrankia californiensis]